MENEGDEIKSKQASKRDRTLLCMCFHTEVPLLSLSNQQSRKLESLEKLVAEFKYIPRKCCKNLVRLAAFSLRQQTRSFHKDRQG